VVKLQTNLTAAGFAVSRNNPYSLAGSSQADFNHFAPMLERIDAVVLAGSSLAAVATSSMGVGRDMSNAIRWHGVAGMET
jgi:hypothetical protein